MNCDKVRVTFINVPDARETTIAYILFKGFKEEGEDKKKLLPKNISKNDEEFKYSGVKVPVG